MTRVARYTQFVAWIKRSLWVLVAGIIGLLVWIASDSTGENGARVVFSSIAKSENLASIMWKPHYQGVDAKNQPYTVIADKATQLDSDHIALESIRADLTMNNGKWLALNSGSGVLNVPAKQLELTNHVDMFYDGGYEFRTDHAHVDIQQGSAYGDAPVEGQGPTGTLKADGFTSSQRGQVIRFNGSVRMKLYR